MTDTEDHPTQEDARSEDAELEQAEMFRSALLNGAATIERLIKLVDIRFTSQARRTNKLRQAQREDEAAISAEVAALRKELKPLLDFVHFLPYIGSGLGILITGVVVVLKLVF